MPKVDNQTIQAFKLILSYWENYADEDKFFLFHPSKQAIYLGITHSNNHEQSPYLLYPMTFFGSNHSQKPRAFKYYCIIENGIIKYNTLNDFSNENINNLDINSLSKAFNIDDKFSTVKHDYTRHNDNYDNWKTIFHAIQEKISKHELSKVVAARKIAFKTKDKFNFSSIVLNLYNNNPNSYIFAHKQHNETFFGASPELLVEKEFNHIKSYALAGTVKKDSQNVKEQAKSFLCDKKNTFEHNLVIDAILSTMQKLGTNINIGTSHILELKNLLHIKTDLYATDTAQIQTSCKSVSPRILQWVNELHPTPALGGSPKDKALNFIENNEHFQRGHYGAPFGIVDTQGNGFFIVAIRSASIIDDMLYAYAGCGIVAQSNCDEEYEEIDNKLATIIEAL